MDNLLKYARAGGEISVGELPDGADALVFAQGLRLRGGVGVFVASDDSRAAAFKNALKFFGSDIDILEFPSWDCLPYDRISPSRTIAARRAGTLYQLSQLKSAKPTALITTINAITQRVPPRDVLVNAGMHLKKSGSYVREDIEQYFTMNGYTRASTVIEPGDFAIRGGLIDVFPPGFDAPMRLDFFGDELETLRSFDVETQMSTSHHDELVLSPVSEVFLNAETMAQFRKSYIAAFGGGLSADPVYAAVSQGIRYQGLEHWLPLLYPAMETLVNFVPQSALWAFDDQCQQARAEREDLIADYYQARAELGVDSKESSYRALPPDQTYVLGDEYATLIEDLDRRQHSPFTVPEGARALNLGGTPARNFGKERQTEGVNVFDIATQHLKDVAKTGQRLLVASWTAGSSERMGGVFADHGLVIGELDKAGDFASVQPGQIKRVILPIENGFTFGDLSILSEQDILGDRLVRRGRRTKGKNFIAEASVLQEGDLVIHIDHGLGRYIGLKSLDVQNAPHDCLEIEYAGASTLYLPVENIELLSRYGAGGENPVLDRLGGTAWQSRKAKAKNRLKDMAAELIKVAAARALKTSEKVDIPEGAFAEFSARFPYAETQDQLNAIEDVVTDLSSGRPMDRLVCGDVGFGKTEVALRAAFLMAMSGKQVAVVAPTTILCRQHFATFAERFKGLPVKIRQLSRLVPSGKAKTTREEIANGQCDIVIGTHALLAKSISFSDLGLLIVDEEQRFGVQHKERLKALRANVHVLTLTATPIPRTLQMALSGIRDLSLIATPPVDRLAVRTYITPYDTVILREALLREKYRGGQSFFVVPRIADLRRCEEFLKKHVPEVSYVMAHGRMAPAALEDVMTAFYDRQYDVLLSTSIIESGIDIPSANTMIIYRSDRFGLAQLYQMRGRVGRSKTRAYAYLTTPDDAAMTPGALRRMKILQSLDTLGAGFSLASHDLDMRGGGNPLGEEQSGHIKDLGVELYQHMLEEAVAELRQDETVLNRSWSPQVNVGVPILIPDDYVADLNVRLSLYRRMSELTNDDEGNAFAAELIDRFGVLPQEVKNLLQVLSIKRLAKTAFIEKIDAGPKGAVYTFRHQDVKDPALILGAINNHPNWRLRPDQTVLVLGRLDDPTARLNQVHSTLKALQPPNA
ncbi:MAG: transcription-repair coupling factor [Acidimicrobiales bacterium]|nr:transcription-repair coupling factor [Hyphomonadaceae bacterium]RZV41513.1 MAG: transcription-repair coupling factor [Acidimicrobiales bacterium]